MVILTDGHAVATPLYFGLGEAATVDRTDVKRPSGWAQAVTSGLRPNSTVELREP